MNKLILFLAIGFLFVMPISAQVVTEREVIRGAALNYAEGWYEGNADKMESSLHPDLAKRIVRTNDKGQSGLNQMSAMSLAQGTRAGSGNQTPTESSRRM